MTINLTEVKEMLADIDNGMDKVDVWAKYDIEMGDSLPIVKQLMEVVEAAEEVSKELNESPYEPPPSQDDLQEALTALKEPT